MTKTDALAAEILARRGGEVLDVDALWDAVRADRESNPWGLCERRGLPTS